MADQKIDSFTVGVGLSSGEFRDGIDEIVAKPELLAEAFKYLRSIQP